MLERKLCPSNNSRKIYNPEDIRIVQSNRIPGIERHALNRIEPLSISFPLKQEFFLREVSGKVVKILRKIIFLSFLSLLRKTSNKVDIEISNINKV